ncbi:MAG: response regulator [Campylobacterota bacterium]|nr:response regulator [Campylobacterota bacterium]
MDDKISHEISNYLHQIISNAELISKDEKNIKHIQMIQNAAYSIDALITDTTVIKPTISINSNSNNIELTKFKNLNILVVDDIIDNIYIMENIFNTLSCNMVSAMNGEEAISTFKNGFIPNIVCMDMIMPGMDGTSTTKELKELGCDAYFIAISALKNQSHEITSLFNCWLPKPFTLEQIVDALSGYNNQNTKNQHINTTFKIDSEISNEIKKELLYMAENGLYTSLKRVISSLDESKSKEFLNSSLKNIDLHSIIKSLI